jgi:phytanoyl-CoA hydroxylase
METHTDSDIMPRAEILLRPSTDGSDRYPPLSDARRFKAYFEREGFVVVRRAVDASLCQGAKQAFLDEMLPAKTAYFLRHASGKHERHVYTPQGFMKYPIMNLQDVTDRHFPNFKRRSLDLLTQETIKQAMHILFEEPGRVVHTMYFDGNQTTWAHRDGHYFDSSKSGAMVGVWVAAEDIHPDAGRFFILPGSHRQSVPGERQDPNGANYKTIMADFVRHGPLECVSPVLEQGDIVLWNSLTIHGSLPTVAPQFSRRSFTAHYIPQSHHFQRPFAKTSKSRTMLVNGVEVSLHADNRSLLGLLKNSLREDFPQLYGMARRLKTIAASALAQTSADGAM